MSKLSVSFRHSIVLVLGILFATTYGLATSSKIQIQAKSIESTGDIAIAKDNVVVHYDDMMIRATSATFNKKTHLLVLDGNIETIGYDGTKEHSTHMEINTESKEVNFQKLFLVSENDVWIMSDTVNKVDSSYKLGTSLLSSCDITDPLWTMHFSHSTYNKNEDYIKVYNAKVYMWDIPIFYSPYLAFSTNRQRSSGLLFPLIGFTPNEGYFYEQPIFWAISPSMDLEVNPQIRTDRSMGMYGTLRFVDSNHSQGTLRVGYFKDNAGYVTENNLPNDTHYGLEFNYQSKTVLQQYLPHDFSDGLYVNTTYLNDIEYLTLQKHQLSHFGRSPLQESRINYFTQNNNYYFGLNAKYFIDTREGVDKDETLQILPSMQLHKYVTHFIIDNFTYSVDLKMNDFDRVKGTTLKQVEFRVPLEFSTSFLDDFLNLSVSEELFYSKSFFGNQDFMYNDYAYYNNTHKIKIFTDLTKDYDGFIHVLQPSLSYVLPGAEKQSPVIFKQLDTKQKELFSVGLPLEQYNFALSQYFYDENMALKFYQRLTQVYSIDKSYHLSDLSNEMQYNFDALSLYNILEYSHQYNTIRFSSSSVSYRQSDYSISMGHSYKQVLADDPNARASNDVTFNFGYTYNQQISFNGGLIYNIDDSSSKQWKFGARYYRDCWSADISVRQDIRPTSAGPISENLYYLQLSFTPFGSIGTDSLNKLQQ